MLARKIGEEKFKKFIEDTKLLKNSDIQLEEVGNPIKFKWNKCKLETISRTWNYNNAITSNDYLRFNIKWWKNCKTQLDKIEENRNITVDNL